MEARKAFEYAQAVKLNDGENVREASFIFPLDHLIGDVEDESEWGSPP